MIEFMIGMMKFPIVMESTGKSYSIHLPNHQPAINIQLPEGLSPLNHH
jgi:hypothetical protein